MPWRSVKLNILPPVRDFKILFVTWDDWGFFVFAATAVHISGVAIFKPGFTKISQVFSVPVKTFCSSLFINPPSSMNWWGVKVMIFRQFYLGLGHLSCNFKILPLLFKSHHAEFDIHEHWFLQFLLLIKSSPLVVYLVKIWLLLRPQILHVPFIIITTFLVSRFLFSYWFILLALYCFPPTHHVFVIQLPEIIFRRSTRLMINFFFSLGLNKFNFILKNIFKIIWLKNCLI